MTTPVTIIGSYLSPYVRKVLVVLQLKGIDYRIDPIVPFTGDERFSAVSPIRRVPVLIDDRVTLSDSTVICQYLEDRYPSPALYPSNVADRARARWLEEFADTRMGDVIIWRLYNEVTINPYVWGKPTDQALLQKTLDEDLPQVMDYLESQLPAQGWIFGELSIADIGVAVFFRNAGFARWQPDVARWPKTAALVQRALALEAFERLKPYEHKSLRTPIPQQRAALMEMGAPLTTETFGTAAPRRGPMST
ncbi:glutathione S-transferase family protein [Solimonas sp. K1W22B-7]|uniref:glutathione S-transferase family protein n=1 Tax=Solimonas sp. K1W22B-7 TaxID=2303331 RepID=UPI000E32DD2E|nr:glutathione S-transferase family protein [Solimonas sp. K1W22B-7]AXQ28646.1 glutathione S-transferase family protein [Solimonas sp. K1W22B-7]